MKRVTSILTVLGFLALGLYSASIPAANAASSGPDLTDQYIVTLHDGTDSRRAANDHARQFDVDVSHVFGTVIDGYSGKIRGTSLAALRRDPRVASIERDQLVTTAHHACGHTHPKHGAGDCSTTTTTASTTTTTTTQPPEGECPDQTLPWGIDRVDADVASVLAGDCEGTVSGVTVYVIDTGVASHSDLNVVGHVNFTGDGQNTDCNNHGTHVAGTIAAADNNFGVVGVLPGAPVVGVKVLGCNGSGTWSGVIAGVNWVAANADGASVANMSLSGGASTSIDNAVIALANTGVPVAVAAGNDNANACNSSPARAGVNAGVISVGALDSSDQRASFSNYGSCVDIWAPGVGVLSTLPGGGYASFSGTSMASPHVAGAAGLALVAGSTSSADAESDLLAEADNVAWTSGRGKRKNTTNVDALNVGGF